MREHVKFLIDEGMKVVLLSTGISEYLHLSEEEVRAVAQNVVRAVDGRALLIVSTGQSWTGQSAEFVRFAEDIGVDAVLVVAPDPSYMPYEPERHDDALYAHFETVAAATRLGLLFHEQQLPGHGIFRPWSVDLIKRVAAIDNVIGLKEESWDFVYSMEILAEVGKDVVMIDDGGKISFIFTHGYGSPAYISGMGQYAPQVSRSFWNALESGDLAEARRIAVDIDMATRRFSGRFGWLAFVKASMELCGLPGSPMRRPGISLTAGQKEEVRQWLDRLDLLPN